MQADFDFDLHTMLHRRTTYLFVKRDTESSR